MDNVPLNKVKRIDLTNKGRLVKGNSVTFHGLGEVSVCSSDEIPEARKVTRPLFNDTMGYTHMSNSLHGKKMREILPWARNVFISRKALKIVWFNLVELKLEVSLSCHHLACECD